MGLLRIVILVLLILLVVRLLTNFLAELGRRVRRPSAPPPTGRPPSVPSTQPRLLVACPVCGTYFEPRRGLHVAAGSAGAPIAVCSEPCRARHAETLRDGGRR